MTQVRRILNDLDAPYRYTDNHLYELLNVAIHDLKRVRPDAFIGTLNNITSYTPFGAGGILDTNVVNVDDIFLRPLIHYIGGSAELIDEEFTADGRAAILLKSFGDSVGPR